MDAFIAKYLINDRTRTLFNCCRFEVLFDGSIKEKLHALGLPEDNIVELEMDAFMWKDPKIAEHADAFEICRGFEIEKELLAVMFYTNAKIDPPQFPKFKTDIKISREIELAGSVLIERHPVIVYHLPVCDRPLAHANKTVYDKAPEVKLHNHTVVDEMVFKVDGFRWNMREYNVDHITLGKYGKTLTIGSDKFDITEQEMVYAIF